MAKEFIVYCTCQSEGPAYADGGNQQFAVFLAAECVGEWSDEDARQAIKQFLEGLDGMKLAFYKVALPTADGKPNALSETVTTKLVYNAGAGHGNLFNWLVDRSEKLEQFWKSSKIEGEADADNLKSSALLLGSRNWPAPAPHQLGLVRIVQPTSILGTDAEHTWILVPKIDGLPDRFGCDIKCFGSDEQTRQPPESPKQPKPCKTAELTNFKKGGDGAALETIEEIKDVKIVVSVVSSSGNAAEVSLVGSDGFIPVSALTDETVRALRLYEDNANLIEGSAGFLLDPSVIKKIRFKNEKLEARADIADGLSWFAKAGAAAIVDTISLALCMPGLQSGNGSDDDIVEGPILGHFVDALQLALGAAIDDAKIQDAAKNTIGNALESGLIGPIREAMKEVQPLCNVEQSASDRETHETALATVLGLPALSIKGVPSPLMVLGALLTEKSTVDDLEKALSADTSRQLRASGRDPSTYPLVSAALVAALNDLLLQMQTESGLEKAMLRFITDGETAGFLTALAKQLTVAEDLVENAFNAFEAFIEGDFNGANAARQATASLFSWALSHGNDGKLPSDAIEILKRATYLTNRWTSSNSTTTSTRTINADALYDALARTLWRPVAEPSADVLDVIKKLRQEAITRTFEPARFVPDARPAGLPIQLAASGSQQAVHDFNEAYAGVCVLMRVKNERISKPWACANLTTVKVPVENDDAKPAEGEIPQLSPLRPVVNDGVVRSVLAYEGLPFASTAYRDTLIAGMEDGNAGGNEPYAVEDDFDHPNKVYPKPPALAYGVTYEIAEFAVSKGGRPPHSISRTDTGFPALTYDISGVPGGVATQTYQRRTMIGRAALSPAAGEQRVGYVPDEVEPLSLDYPRSALIPGDHFDFGRSDLGAGLLEPASQDTLTKRDADEAKSIARFDGLLVPTDTQIEIKLLTDAEAEPTVADSGLTVKLQPRDHNGKSLQFWQDDNALTFVLGDQQRPPLCLPKAPYWIRLTCTKGEVSFDTPDFNRRVGVDRASSESAPLVLIGSDSDIDPKFSQAVKLSLGFPRTTFEDFRRWTSNSKLPIGQSATIGQVDDLLAMAHFARGAREKISTLLDRLPDPAVSKVQLQLIVLDNLEGAVKENISVAIDVPKFPVPDMNDFRNSRAPLEHFERYLQTLDQQFSRLLKVSVGDPEINVRNDLITIKVPAGHVARLRVRSLVEKSLFEKRGTTEPLHKGLRQLAAAEIILNGMNYLAFDGDALTIEAMTATMPDDLPKLLKEAVKTETLGSDRAYEIRAHTPKPNASSNWKYVGKILIETQRWTPSGRPIDSWLAPTNPQADQLRSPAIEITGEFEDFEKEAFFDRSNDDSYPETIRLEPGAGATLLKTATWAEPSATYFRHRFAAISRYRGAFKPLRRDRAVVRDPKFKDKDNPWLLRVAMLADGKRVDLTRPQQRALVPLGRPKIGQAMSIATILQEPPYSSGGLADRLIAEIETAPGFRIDNNNLSISDLSKEIGPDPRLIQTAYGAEESSSIVLDLDGPIGLTLEPDSGEPIFANSAYTLTPRVAGSATIRFEETFLRVRCERYLDPAWVYDPVRSERDTENTAIWFDISDSASIKVKGPDAQGEELATIEKGAEWIVEVDATFLRALEPNSKPLTVCRAKTGDDGFESLIIIFIPGKGEGARLIVLGKSGSKRPVSLASIRLLSDKVDGIEIYKQLPSTGASVLFEDSSPGDSDGQATDPDATTDSSVSKVAAVPCRISDPTFAEWCRTSRDFTRVHIGSGQTILVEDIFANIESNGGLTFKKREGAISAALWIRPQVQESKFAQHVHRHLVAILTRRSWAKGSKARVFLDAARADAETVKFSSVHNITDDMDVRVQLAELETPARPLGFSSTGNIPSSFSAIDIDLFALTGQREGLRDEELLICGRFLNDMSKVESVSFKIGQSEFHIGNTKNASGFEIALKNTLKNVEISGVAIGKDGDLTNGINANLREGWKDFNRLTICSVGDPGFSGEFWCDCSVRILRGTPSNSVLAGLFSTDWEVDDGLPRPQNNRSEAQTRLVALSPMIPVKVG